MDLLVWLIWIVFKKYCLSKVPLLCTIPFGYWYEKKNESRSFTLSAFLFLFLQAVFSSVFYFASVPLYQGFLIIGWDTSSEWWWLIKRVFGCLVSLAFPLCWSTVEIRDEENMKLCSILYICHFLFFFFFSSFLSLSVTPLPTPCSLSSLWCWTKMSSQKLPCCTQNYIKIYWRYLMNAHTAAIRHCTVCYRAIWGYDVFFFFSQGRPLSFKTFLVWVLISIYQGKRVYTYCW